MCRAASTSARPDLRTQHRRCAQRSGPGRLGTHSTARGHPRRRTGLGSRRKHQSGCTLCRCSPSKLCGRSLGHCRRCKPSTENPPSLYVARVLATKTVSDATCWMCGSFHRRPAVVHDIVALALFATGAERTVGEALARIASGPLEVWSSAGRAPSALHVVCRDHVRPGTVVCKDDG